MDDEEATIHVLLGCRLCADDLSHGNGNAWTKEERRRSDEHTFCLRCGTPAWPNGSGCQATSCKGETYSHG